MVVVCAMEQAPTTRKLIKKIRLQTVDNRHLWICACYVSPQENEKNNRSNKVTSEGEEEKVVACDLEVPSGDWVLTCLFRIYCHLGHLC